MKVSRKKKLLEENERDGLEGERERAGKKMDFEMAC